MLGVAQSLPVMAANTFFEDYRTDWLEFPIYRDRVRPVFISSGEDTDVNSVSMTDLFAPYDQQTILLAVNTIQTDSTTPTTPTITGGATTWVQVASTAYDVTGSVRGKLTLFRTQANQDSFFDAGAVIDYAAVTQDATMYQLWLLDGEDRSGTNGSAAIVQNATGTAASDFDCTASLASFGNAKNATMAFVAILDETTYPDPIFYSANWNDWYRQSLDYGGIAFSMLVPVHTHANQTAPSMSFTSNALASGMIAVELKKDLINPSADCGEFAASGYGGYVPAGLSNYSVTPTQLEYRFQT